MKDQAPESRSTAAEIAERTLQKKYGLAPSTARVIAQMHYRAQTYG